MKNIIKKCNQLNNMFLFILYSIKNDKSISLNNLHLFLSEMNALFIEIENLLKQQIPN